MLKMLQLERPYSPAPPGSDDGAVGRQLENQLGSVAKFLRKPYKGRKRVAPGVSPGLWESNEEP